MTATFDSLATAPPAMSDAAFGHRLAPAGDPLEGEGFDALFEAKIKPGLVALEAERQRAVRLFFIVLGAGVAAILVEMFFAIRGTGDLFGYAGLNLFTLVGAGCLAYLPLGRVGRKARICVLAALCEPLGITYSPTGGDGPAFPSFVALKLLPHFSEKSFQDFFSGRRGVVDFALCEASLHQGSGKERHEVFRGQLLRLVTPRRLASQTVVLRNTGWPKQFECPAGLRPVGLEDPVFNQAFAVFGSDQVEAREILTPTFMQHLNDLEAAYAGAHIRCAFDETQLLIALEGQNRFLIGGLFSSLVEKSRVEALARSLEQVFKLIDEFKDA
jgi:Protein of unknown function (DUF3137)